MEVIEAALPGRYEYGNLPKEEECSHALEYEEFRRLHLCSELIL